LLCWERRKLFAKHIYSAQVFSRLWQLSRHRVPPKSDKKGQTGWRNTCTARFHNEKPCVAVKLWPTKICKLALSLQAKPGANMMARKFRDRGSLCTLCSTPRDKKQTSQMVRRKTSVLYTALAQRLLVARCVCSLRLTPRCRSSIPPGATLVARRD
jgi:hypothetical protein